MNTCINQEQRTRLSLIHRLVLCISKMCSFFFSNPDAYFLEFELSFRA